MGADEGKRKVVHHEWRLEREGDAFFDGSTVGRGGYIGDGAVFGRRVQRGWEWSTAWAIMARKGIYLAGVE